MEYTPRELEIIRICYELSEFVHSKETRADGKLYMQHPVEVAQSEVDMERLLHIRCARTVALCLAHDVGETILKAFDHIYGDSDKVDESDIHVIRNFKEIAKLTSHLSDLDEILFSDMQMVSKSRDPEKKKRYFPSMLLCKSIPVLVGKTQDRTNNAPTFYRIPESKDRKVEETIEFFPLIIARIDVLIKRAVVRGELSENWLALPGHLHNELAKALGQYIQNFPKLF